MKVKLVIALVWFICTFGYGQSGAIDTSFLHTGIPFGLPVSADAGINRILLEQDGKMLLTGNFTEYNNYKSRRIVRVFSNGKPDTTFKTTSGFNNGFVNAIHAADSNYLCFGSFTTYNGLTGNRVIKLLRNGQIDTSFKSGLGFNNTVLTAVTLPDGGFLLGGLFTSYNGFSCNYLIKLNKFGQPDTTFNLPNLNNQVNSVLYHNNLLYVAGSFSANAQQSKNYFLALDLNGNPQNQITLNTTAAINQLVKITDSSFMVVGNFNFINNLSFRQLAIVKSADYSIDTNFNTQAGFNGDVNRVCVINNNRFLVLGDYNRYRNNITNNPLQINGLAEPILNTGLQAIHSGVIVDAVYHQEGKLVVGGLFTVSGYNTKNNFTAFNINGELDLNFNRMYGPNGRIRSIQQTADNRFLIFGDFSTYNDLPYKNLLMVNGNGEIDTSFKFTVNYTGSIIFAHLMPNGKILLGGGFITADSAYQNLIRLNKNGSIDTTLKTEVSSNRPILAGSTDFNEKILIGGSFEFYRNNFVNNMALLFNDGGFDATLSGTAIPSGPITKITALPDGKWMVFGNFQYWAGVTRGYFTRLLNDGSTDTSFNIGTGANQIVNDVKLLPNGSMIIAGNFTEINGVSCSKIAKLNNNGQLDSNFNRMLAINGVINSVHIEPSKKIIIGGNFTFGSNKTIFNLMRLDSNGFIDPTFNVGYGLNAQVLSINADIDGQLLIGGDFRLYDSTNYVSRFIKIKTNCDFAQMIQVKNDSSCLPSSLQLSVLPNKGRAFWYSTISGGNAIFEGMQFTTPILQQTTTYYVELVLNNCITNPRYPVTAIIKSKPDLTVFNDSICAGKIATLKAITSAKNTFWQFNDSIVYVGNTFSTWPINQNTTFNVWAEKEGCSSDTLKASVIIGTPQSQITQINNALVAPPNQQLYSWINCNNNMVMQTGNSNRFEPTDAGRYKVAVLKGGCFDTSICVNYNTTQITTIEDPAEEISVYPNPVTDLLTIKTNQNVVAVEIYTIGGLLVNSNAIDAAKHIQIPCNNLVQGIYLVNIKTLNGQEHWRKFNK